MKLNILIVLVVVLMCFVHSKCDIYDGIQYAKETLYQAADAVVNKVKPKDEAYTDFVSRKTGDAIDYGKEVGTDVKDTASEYGRYLYTQGSEYAQDLKEISGKYGEEAAVLAKEYGLTAAEYTKEYAGVGLEKAKELLAASSVTMKDYYDKYMAEAKEIADIYGPEIAKMAQEYKITAAQLAEFYGEILREKFIEYYHLSSEKAADAVDWVKENAQVSDEFKEDAGKMAIKYKITAMDYAKLYKDLLIENLREAFRSAISTYYDVKDSLYYYVNEGEKVSRKYGKEAGDLARRYQITADDYAERFKDMSIDDIRSKLEEEWYSSSIQNAKDTAYDYAKEGKEILESYGQEAADLAKEYKITATDYASSFKDMSIKDIKKKLEDGWESPTVKYTRDTVYDYAKEGKEILAKYGQEAADLAKEYKITATDYASSFKDMSVNDVKKKLSQGWESPTMKRARSTVYDYAKEGKDILAKYGQEAADLAKQYQITASEYAESFKDMSINDVKKKLNEGWESPPMKKVRNTVYDYAKEGKEILEKYGQEAADLAKEYKISAYDYANSFQDMSINDIKKKLDEKLRPTTYQKAKGKIIDYANEGKQIAKQYGEKAGALAEEFKLSAADYARYYAKMPVDKVRSMLQTAKESAEEWNKMYGPKTKLESLKKSFSADNIKQKLSDAVNKQEL